MKIPSSTLYNPHNQSKQELIDHFVVRIPLFKDLYQEIIDWEDTIQDFVIEGKRGMGKTTLLLRLNYEIENNPERHWLIPVVFKEEIYYRVSRLERLWEETAQMLESKDPKFIGLYQKMVAAYAENVDYERLCFEMLEKAIKKHKKKIILFIDNLGEMLQNFSLKDNQRLREILISTRDLRIVGGTSIFFEGFFNYKHPFYEFFHIISLKGLSKQETHTLLHSLAETEGKTREIERILHHDPARVETLRLLSGGVTRTLVLMFDVLLSDEDGKAISDLEKILDQVTPLYQHRLQDLRAEQREIIDKIALAWDAISLEDLATQLRQTPEALQTHLQHLSRLEIIQRIPAPTDTHLYQIQERFFNIWYLMRLAPAGIKQKVLWLVRFFEAWYCEPEYLKERIKKHLVTLKDKKFSPKEAHLYYEIFSRLDHIDLDTQYELISETSTFIRDNELQSKMLDTYEKANGRDSAIKEALEFGLEITYPTAYIEGLIGTMYLHFKDYENAEKKFKLAYEKGDDDILPILGCLYEHNHKGDVQAEKYNLMIIKRGDSRAMNKLGWLYHQILQDYKKAEKYYLMAVKKGNITAMYNLGWLYENHYHDYEQAKKYYFMAVEKGNTNAMNNLGYLYAKILQDYSQAEKYYFMAVEKGNTNAMNNLGLLYLEILQDYKQAERYFLMAIEKGNIQAMFSLAALLLRNKEYTRAESIFQKLLDTANFMDIEAPISDYLTILLALQQYRSFATHFEKSDYNFKDRFKPLYYAYLKLVNHPDYLKMPPEIGETVALIIEEVNRTAEELDHK